MTDRMAQFTCVQAAGKPVAEQRKARPKAEEVLIEEILKAAGLEALD